MRGDVDRIRELADRLAELDRLIRGLDPAVRAALLGLLAPHRSSAAADEDPAPPEPGPPVPARGTPAALPGSPGLARFAPARPGTPGDNVILCSAMILAEQGGTGLTATGIRARAEAMGLRVPRDPLRTLRPAREGGRALFRFEDGRWRLTATGKAHLHRRFGVRLPGAGPAGGARSAPPRARPG